MTSPVPITVVLLVGLASSAMAAPTSIPSNVKLQPGFMVPAPRGLEARLVADAADGTLDSVDLVSAALVASGVPEEGIAAEKVRLEKAIEGARAQARTQKTAKKRGDRLLRGLHDTVLRRYVEQQSRVDAVITTGEFNCLSSAVVFAIAADGLIDHPRGMLSLTHAFVRVDVDGVVKDVETTARAGFAVDRKALVTREYLRQLGVGDGLSEEERRRDLQNPEEVSTLGLVAGLYSNRGVLATRQGDLEGAAIAFDRATRLSSGELKVRVANWRAALLNNAVAGLIADGRAADARRLLALALDGATGETRKTLLQNLAATAAAQAEIARTSGRFAEAMVFIDDAIASGGLTTSVRNQMLAVRAELEGRLAGGDHKRCGSIDRPADRARCLAATATTLLEQGKVDEALDTARRASTLASGLKGAGDAAEATDAVLFNSLLKAINRGRDDKACARVEDLVRELVDVAKRLPNPPAVDGPRQMASCHWKGATDAIDAGDLDAAAAAFARAAVHLPREQGLRNNRAEIELRRAEVHARAGRCDEARPLVRRAQSLVDDSRARGERLLEVCANERSGAFSSKQQWAEAVLELRRGLLDVPGSEVLRDNLGRMLHNVAVSELKAGECDNARALLPDLDTFKKPIADDVRRRCP
jgi:tetratricopeptide (TPR) repeat protein